MFFDPSSGFVSTKNAWGIIARFILLGSTECIHLTTPVAAGIITRYTEASISASYRLAVPHDLFVAATVEVMHRIAFCFRPSDEFEFAADFASFRIAAFQAAAPASANQPWSRPGALRNVQAPP